MSRSGLILTCLAIVGVLGLWSCAKQGGTTFTPAIRAVSPATISSVTLDAQRWVDAGAGRFWSFIAPTGSMRPFIDESQVVLCVKYTGQPLTNGAAVIFNRGDAPRVLHVVSDQTADSVYMSGANNHYSDGWFKKTVIEGVVVGQLALP